MKKGLRFLVWILTLAMAASVLSVSLMAETTETPIVSPSIDVLGAVGLEHGNAPSGHGQHQTRLVHVSSGSYLGLLYDDQTVFEEGGNAYRAAILKVDEEGNVSIITQVLVGASSTTVSVVADKDENIWLCSCWDQGSGFMMEAAWGYFPKENKVEDYSYRGYYRKGGGYGYPVVVMDHVNNCFYNVAVGGDTPKGYVCWETFDLNTKTWSGTINAVKVDARYCYHYAYATGKGGFFLSNERDVKVASIDSNLGHSVYQDMNELRSRKLDAGYMWDEAHILIINDAKVAEVVDMVLEPAVYDVENGIYPNCVNVDNDAIMLDNGLFYTVISMDDNGTPGYRKILKVVDTNTVNADGTYKVLATKELVFEYGRDVTYFQKFFLDTAGNLYLVATKKGSTHLEVWKAYGENLTDFKLVYETDTGTTFEYSGMMSTSRGGSILTDTGYMIYVSSYDAWRYLTIDFSQIRELELAK